ncbi:MAG TPA: sulfotransferase, partial [Burkholderiaceae bacterium]|nr:sulfotransferase [Burkholderiaceae bacterium]
MVQKLEAPLIIIGNAGSGSTLLERTLSAHPDIEMKGELNFLIAHAWAAFERADANTILRGLSRHFDADPDLETRIKGDSAQFQELLGHLRDEEFERRGTVLRQVIAAWFCLDESHSPFWGFK